MCIRDRGSRLTHEQTRFIFETNTVGITEEGVPLPYPKSPITYVTEYPATHFLRDTFRGINGIVQEQQAVHDTL